MLVVIDTNVLVSALLSPGGKPARVLDLVINGTLKMCYDSRILIEYEAVLSRDKFKLNKANVNILIGFIKRAGISIIANPLEMKFIDEDDKKIYEVAKKSNASLITGNTKHFPDDECIKTVTEFLTE